MDKIPFNKPYLTGHELTNIEEVLKSGKHSGDGPFSQKCHNFFQEHFGFRKALLTTSCTDALEMAAILSNISPGDEVIVPSFTFPSSATAFVLRGAKIIFADSCSNNPNIDANQIESLITDKTKALVIVHYAGIACDMEIILQLVKKYKLFLIEDAAHAIDSYYNDIPLGKFGNFGTFSFHETKNLSSGEGGMLVINDPDFIQRSEIIREKGTNRSSFFRGEINKYGWVDIGSSFLPSEITAAVLFAQLMNISAIQQNRLKIWHLYHQGIKHLADKGYFNLPIIPDYATNNAHMFYLVCRSDNERQALINHLKNQGILAVFHYQSLHLSPFYIDKHDNRELPNSDHFSRCLLRLPLFCGLTSQQAEYIIDKVSKFYE